MTETIQEPQGIEFPPKPQMTFTKQQLSKSIFSSILFIGAFYFFLKWDISSILLLVVVILIHELGHFLAMKAYKYKDLGIFFVPLVGAYATGTKDRISQKQHLVILLAGPLPGILFGIALYVLAPYYEHPILSKLANMFLLINFFNLLPIMPLDGGKIVKALFFEKNELINTIFVLLSIALMTLFCLATKSYFLLIIPFFLLIQLRAQAKNKTTRQAALNYGIDVTKSFDDLEDQEYWRLRDILVKSEKAYSRFATPGKYLVSENENQIIKHVKLILQNKTESDMKVWGKLAFTLILFLNLLLTAIAIVVYLINAEIIQL